MLRSEVWLRYQVPHAVGTSDANEQHNIASARPRLTNTRGRKRKVTSDDSHNNHKTLMLMTDKSGLRHQFTMWFRSATARTLTAHMQVAPPLRSPRMTDSTLSVLPRIEIHWKIPSVAGANGPAYAHRKDRFGDQYSQDDIAGQQPTSLRSNWRHRCGNVPLTCASRVQM